MILDHVGVILCQFYNWFICYSSNTMSSSFDNLLNSSAIGVSLDHTAIKPFMVLTTFDPTKLVVVFSPNICIEQEVYRGSHDRIVN